MFRIQDISGGIHERKSIKATPLEPTKVGEITFQPRSCTFSKTMAQNLDRIRNFTVRENDVWMISIPKSGTTWSQEMCWLISNNFDFETAKNIDIGIRCPSVELTGIGVDTIDSFENAEKLDSPRLLQSHLPLPFLPRELWTKNPKIIYIARDPRDVAVSRYLHSKSWFKLTVSKNDFFKAFINNEVNFTPYFDHVLEFWKIRNQPNVLFLTYEEMISDLKAVVLKTCNFFNKVISSDQLEEILEHLSFGSMKNNKACWREYQRKLLSSIEPDDNYRFIRRGIVGSYKDELPKELLESYNEWMRSNLKDSDCDIFQI